MHEATCKDGATQHSMRDLPASTIDAAKSKQCLIHFCNPTTSGRDERGYWLVQQGDTVRHIASLVDLVWYIERMAPDEPLVLESVRRRVVIDGRVELQEVRHA